MTIHVLASVLMMFAVSLLTVLVRRDARWHRMQILQVSVALLAAVMAFSSGSVAWLLVGAAILIVFVFVPRLIQSRATQWRMQERWSDAAQAETLAGWIMGGQNGRLARALGTALRAVGQDDLARAEVLLDSLAARALSAGGRDDVQLLKLAILLQRRQWLRAVEFFDNVHSWGSVTAATRARLRVARGYAELGEMNRALRCLEFVALSPLGAVLDHEYWPTRLRLAAMAGDLDELEKLLDRKIFTRRAFGRVAAYWRGRCALAQGDHGAAQKLLTRAYTLTYPGDRFWREAIQHYLAKTEIAAPPAAVVAQSPAYGYQLASLHHAEQTAAPWRLLVQPGQPGIATIILFAVIAICFGLQTAVPALHDWLILHAANSHRTIASAEWWRAFTALFLHADLLHFVMNGLALWMFGGVVERGFGRGRMLLLFLMAGAAANTVSALVGKYDYAIGASSGLFGLVGAYAVLIHRVHHPLFAAARRRLLIFLAVVVAGDFIFGALEPQIDDIAHMGGFGAGILLGWMLAPRPQSLGQPTEPPL